MFACISFMISRIFLLLVFNKQISRDGRPNGFSGTEKIPTIPQFHNNYHLNRPLYFDSCCLLSREYLFPMEETKRPTMPRLISKVDAQIVGHPKYLSLDSNTRYGYEMSRNSGLWKKKEINAWSRALWKHLYWSEPLAREYDMSIKPEEASELMKRFGYKF
jgi:hypothetical protein